MGAQALDRIERGEFFLIAGPCVIESDNICFEVAERVSTLSQTHGVPFIFKSSYKKANRLSADSYSGPGLEKGLQTLARVKERFGLPILTDVHETCEVEPVSQVADVLQIPAFLCRQTDLIVKTAVTGKWINIKKGQVLADEHLMPAG